MFPDALSCDQDRAPDLGVASPTAGEVHGEDCGMDEEASISDRVYGNAYQRDGTETLTELTYYLDGRCEVEVVRFQRYRER